jgi:hypothetical protein
MQQEADTLRQLLQSRAFVTSVIKRTPLKSKMGSPRGRARTIAFVRKNMSIEVVGPNALKMSFFGRNPKEAVTIARVTTEEFLAWVQRAAHRQGEESTKFFASRAGDYQKELDRARKQLQRFKEKHPEARQLEIADKVLSAPEITAPPSVQSEFARLKSQEQYAQELYDSSLSDLATTRVVAAAEEERYVNGLRVVDPAVEPVSFSRKRLLLFDLLALMAAVMAGATTVAVAELTDATVRSEQDVEEVLGLRVLTEVRPQPEGVRRA